MLARFRTIGTAGLLLAAQVLDALRADPSSVAARDLAPLLTATSKLAALGYELEALAAPAASGAASWPRVQQALLEALADFPEARAAAARALLSLESSSADHGSP